MSQKQNQVAYSIYFNSRKKESITHVIDFPNLTNVAHVLLSDTRYMLATSLSPSDNTYNILGFEKTRVQLEIFLNKSLLDRTVRETNIRREVRNSLHEYYKFATHSEEFPCSVDWIDIL